MAVRAALGLEAGSQVDFVSRGGRFVLVRFLAQDDARQAAAATRLIEKELTSSRQVL